MRQYTARVCLTLHRPTGGKGADMNDTRRELIQRARTLIEKAKDILEVAATQEQDDFDNMPEDLQSDETGQRAEDNIDALERAAMCCDDAISACEDALQN
jgi:predicted Rossmann fold nucleotide-binding protein DprA/Smf involved in DNA uptake